MCGTQDEHERAGCDESDRRFARANSVHFYGRTPPWGDNCGLCVLYGFVCNSALLRARGASPHCSSHLNAQSLWWSSFLSLPHPTRRYCMGPLSATRSVYHASLVKGKKKAKAKDEQRAAVFAHGAGCSNVTTMGGAVGGAV